VRPYQLIGKILGDHSATMLLPNFVAIVGAFMLLGVVSGQLLRNITVDDKDPAITYTGTWNTGTKEADSYGGGHRSTSRVGAYATYNFTGSILFIPSMSECIFMKLGI
jgi:hypothetical protein